MRVGEVPQETARTYGGVRKLLYAVDEQGDYAGVNSAGWEPETYATLAAVDLIDVQAKDALVRAVAGKTSSLEVHMYQCRMDLETLAATTGIWAWRIRRHFRPAVFQRLPDRILRRYADAMDLSTETLRRLSPEGAV